MVLSGAAEALWQQQEDRRRPRREGVAASGRATVRKVKQSEEGIAHNQVGISHLGKSDFKRKIKGRTTVTSRGKM